MKPDAPLGPTAALLAANPRLLLCDLPREHDRRLCSVLHGMAVGEQPAGPDALPAAYPIVLVPPVAAAPQLGGSACRAKCSAHGRNGRPLFRARAKVTAVAMAAPEA